ncbi:VOC family protein [Nocardia sp. NPDC049220]|uniref:VOC family protein n=1 Tax=Nocardia sp. NPDC049220 TaxID=3155273 RepID=UPI00340D2E38
MNKVQIPREKFLQTPGLEDWRSEHAAVCVCFRTSSLAASAELVQAIAALPGTDDDGLDIDIRGDAVYVRIVTITDEYTGVTDQDVELALAISAVGQRLKVTTEPSAVQAVKVSFLINYDKGQRRELVDFWRAVLGYQERVGRPDEECGGAFELVDPRRRGAPLSFEYVSKQIDSWEGQTVYDRPSHFHVQMSRELVHARLDAAREFGGRDEDEHYETIKLRDPGDTLHFVNFTEVHDPHRR